MTGGGFHPTRPAAGDQANGTLMRVSYRLGSFLTTIASAIVGGLFVAPEAHRFIYHQPYGDIDLPVQILYLSSATLYAAAIGFALLTRPARSRLFPRPVTVLVVTAGLFAWLVAYPIMFGLYAVGRFF